VNEARRVRAEAERKLAETTQRGAEVEALTERLADHVRENGFAKLFEVAFGRRR
jgi:hypothetical protein